MNLCNCSENCVSLVKSKNGKYARGHYHGVAIWPSKSNYKPYFCDCGCMEICGPGKRFVHGHNKSNLGKKFPNLVKSEKWKESMKSPDRSRKLREATSKNWQDEEYRNHMIEVHKDYKWTDEQRNKIISKLKKPHSKEHNRKVGDALRGNPKSQEHIRKLFLASGKKPNKTEIFTDTLVKIACPEEFIYSGNGKIWIEGKNPDWFNVNGKKQVIEMLGTYWHGEKKTGRTNGQEERRLKSHYAKYGYDCLIIWQSELKYQEEVIEKIRKFNSGGK